MKKIILGMAGSLLLCAGVAQAQDSTRTNTGTQPRPNTQQRQTQPQTTTPQTQQQQNPTQTQQSQYRRDDMKVMQQDQLPESLRTTLRGTEYQGWEQSTIYQDPNTGEYLLEMNSTVTNPNNSTTSPTTPQNQSGTNTPRTFRFDRNGQVIQDKNKSGGNQDQ
jgi:hypothetical protein